MTWSTLLISGTCALVLAEHLRVAWLRALAKVVAVAAFLGAAAATGLHTGAPAGQAIMAALLASAVGDIVLLGRSDSALLGGLAAFLLAHVAYVFAFGLLGISFTGAALCTVPMLAFGWRVNRWLSPHTGDLARPVLAYIVVICSMVVAAAGAAWSQPDSGPMLLAVAAVVFVLSDLCVAVDRFIAPSPWVRTVGLPLYFGAQWLFVQGAAATFGV